MLPLLSFHIDWQSTNLSWANIFHQTRIIRSWIQIKLWLWTQFNPVWMWEAPLLEDILREANKLSSVWRESWPCLSDLFTVIKYVNFKPSTERAASHKICSAVAAEDKYLGFIIKTAQSDSVFFSGTWVVSDNFWDFKNPISEQICNHSAIKACLVWAGQRKTPAYGNFQTWLISSAALL